MMRGTGFIELYFSPQMFDEERYAAAAKVLKWAEDNFDIIRNSVFFGDAPEDGGVYGYYAFDDKRGILAIRNSSDKSAEYQFDHKALTFDDCAYSITQFYPVAGETEYVGGAQKCVISLKPFEVKLFNIG